jgi:hypothetical protein
MLSSDENFLFPKVYRSDIMEPITFISSTIEVFPIQKPFAYLPDAYLKGHYSSFIKNTQMKHLLTLSLLAFLLLCFTNSYGQPTKVKAKADKSKAKDAGISNKPVDSKGEDSLNMQGAYSMIKQMVSDGTTDSLRKREQFKIYTDRYMIYASSQLTDSLADYGISTYKMQDGKLIEYVFFTSSDGARKDSFELKINKTGDGYTQIIEFPADSQGRNLY